MPAFEMPRLSVLKRLLCFGLGLALSGFGVALSTRPNLGTSPISSLPYVMTFPFALSFGTWTVIINAFFVLGQILILRKDYRCSQLLQLPAVCVFGICIDLGMWLTGICIPENYVLKLLELLAGSAVLAAGIACELAADVLYVPGEGLVRAICRRWNCDFGKTKVCFDWTLVAIASIASLIFAHRINGIREGTLIAACAVGSFVKFYRKPITAIRQKLGA